MPEPKVYNITEPWLKTNCTLGEGPHFERENNILRFVDIVKQRLHTVNIDEGPSSHKIAAELDTSIGVTADIEGNDVEFAFAGKEGFGIFNRATGKYRYMKKAWNESEIAEGKPHRMRFNDGAVDSRGRFWAGAMNNPLLQEPVNEGALFRLDSDLSLHRVIDGITVPNGLSWSPDNRLMYFTDSPTKRIYKYDFDGETGTCSNRRVFFTADEGEPDGHCWDAEGYMWVAVYGTGKVMRVSEDGKVVAVVQCPTRAVTCPCFAGEELVITSATEDKEIPGFEDNARNAGCVFKVNVGVQGRPTYKFKLDAIV